MTTPVAAAIVGDWNETAADVDALARVIGAHGSIGHGVDRAVVRGDVVMRARRLGRHGSDHPAILYVLSLASGDVVRVVGWNVHGLPARRGLTPTQVARAVAQLVDAHQPHAFVLIEAYRARKALGTIAGYRRRQGRNIGERADVALLIRRDVAIRRRGRLRMTRRWLGPIHRVWKMPRIYPTVRLRFELGGELRLLGYHGPFGAGPVAESRRRLIRWAGKR